MTPERFIDIHRLPTQQLIEKAGEESEKLLVAGVSEVLVRWFRRLVAKVMQDRDIEKTLDALEACNQGIEARTPKEFRVLAAQGSDAMILALLAVLDSVPFAAREEAKIFPDTQTCIVMKV